MSFSRELKDFAAGFRSGAQIAMDWKRTDIAGEKYKPFPEDGGGGDDFPAGGSPQIQTRKGGTKTDPTQTSSTDTGVSNRGDGSFVQQAYDYYRGKGLSHAASAGIAGNLMQESGGLSSVLSGNRRGDRGASGYAAQWQKERLANLMAFTKSRGRDSPSLQDQFDFVLEEMNPDSPYVDQLASNMFPQLQAAKTVEEATALFRKHFERPSADDLGSRTKYALQAVDSGGGAGTFSFGKTSAATSGGGYDEDEEEDEDTEDEDTGGGGGEEEGEGEDFAQAEPIPIPEGVEEQVQNPFAIQVAMQPIAGPPQPYYGEEAQPAAYAGAGGVLPEPQNFQNGGMPMPNRSRMGGGQSLPQGGAIPDAQYFQGGGMGIGVAPKQSVPSYLQAYDQVRAMRAATPTATGGGTAMTPQQITTAAGRGYTQPWTGTSNAGSPARRVNLNIDYKNLGSGPTESQLAFRNKPKPAAPPPPPAAVVENKPQQSPYVWSAYRGGPQGKETFQTFGDFFNTIKTGKAPPRVQSGKERYGSRLKGGMVYARGGAIPDFDELLRQEKRRGDIGGESARDRAAKRYNRAAKGGPTSSAYSDDEGYFRKAGRKSLQSSAGTRKAEGARKADTGGKDKTKTSSTPKTGKSPVAEQKDEQRIRRQGRDPRAEQMEEQRLLRDRDAGAIPEPSGGPTVGGSTDRPGRLSPEYGGVPGTTPSVGGRGTPERLTPTVPYGPGSGTPTGGYQPAPQQGPPQPPPPLYPPEPAPTQGPPAPGTYRPQIDMPDTTLPEGSRMSPPPSEPEPSGRTVYRDPSGVLRYSDSGSPVEEAGTMPGEPELYRDEQGVVRYRETGEPYHTGGFGFARGGAIPDETDPFISERARSAGYTTRGPINDVALEQEPTERPAAPVRQARQTPPARTEQDEDPVYDDVKPTRGLMDEVSRALDGGIRFLTRHFGLDSDRGGIPTPEGQADIEQGAARFARGEGAATHEELQEVDDVVDPNRGLSEDDRMLSRYAKMVKWYQGRGNKEMAEQAAASMMQYGGEKFSQLGTFAQAAYQEYLDTGDPHDLDSTMRFLEKAYRMIPDGAKVDISLNSDTGALEVAREDADGMLQYMDISPDDLPGLIQQVQDKSMYWNRIWRIADKEGYKEHRADQRALGKEERQAGREEYRFQRNLSAKEKAAAAREAAVEKRSKRSLSAADERARLTREGTERRFKQQQKRLDEQFEKTHPEVDWDQITPMLQEAEEAQEAMAVGEGEEANPRAVFEFNQAVSRLYDMLPKTMDRDEWIGNHFERDSWDYERPPYQGKTAPPDKPDAQLAPDGYWYEGSDEEGWSIVTD